MAIRRERRARRPVLHIIQPINLHRARSTLSCRSPNRDRQFTLVIKCMSEVEPSVLLIAGRFSVRGSCAYTLRLAEHLPQRGFRTSVVCPDAHTLDRDRRRELHIDELSQLDWPVWGSVVRTILLRRQIGRAHV